MTHHGGVEIRVAIARHTKRLVQLIKDSPADLTIREQCIVVLGHAVSAAVYDGDTSPKPDVLKAVNITETLRVVIETLKKPAVSDNELNHGMELIARATFNCPEVRIYGVAFGFLITVGCSSGVHQELVSEVVPRRVPEMRRHEHESDGPRGFASPVRSRERTRPHTIRP
jgi:hypothetical protein